MEKFSNVNELVNTLKPVNPIYCIRPDTIKNSVKVFKDSFQGKILSCAYCVGLNDVAIVEIHSGRAIPEDYYEFIKEESNPKIALEGSKKE